MAYRPSDNVSLEIPGIGFARQTLNEDNLSTVSAQRSTKISQHRHNKSPSAGNLIGDVINLNGILQGSMITLENNMSPLQQQIITQHRKVPQRRLASLTDQLEGREDYGGVVNGPIRIPTAGEG